MTPGRLAAAVLAAAVAQLLHVPEPGASSTLNGIYCTSTASCFAVGSYSPAGSAPLNEMLHWNGSAWALMRVPSPGGTAVGALSELLAVRCVKSADCWAVGIYKKAQGAVFSQTLHWNGRKWAQVPVPAPGGTVSGDVNELFDVLCMSSANCVAVGRYGSEIPGIVLLNEVLHWNGRKWALARVPEPAGTAQGDINVLNSVRCPSVRTCMAVGSYGTASGSAQMLNQVLSWNGRKWSEQRVPNPGGSHDGDLSELMGLACSSAVNCWAVGLFGTFTPSVTFIDQALHWNGSRWSRIGTPEPAGTSSGARQDLVNVTCASGTDCWAVGNYVSPNDSTITVNQAEHWDGGMWSLVATPEPGGLQGGDINKLAAVRCLTASNCWAVGQAVIKGGSDFNQALHWGGTRWSAR